MSGADKVTLLYATFPDQETAADVAGALVTAGDAACANILPTMTAVFRWEGAVQRENECVMIVKTSVSRTRAAIERMTALHPYDVPAVVAIPVADGHRPFLDWVQEQTANGASNDTD